MSDTEVIDAEFKPVPAAGKLTLFDKVILALPHDIVERAVGLIGVVLLLGVLFAVRQWMVPWVERLTWDDISGGFITTYVVSSAVLGVVGAVAIYVAAISQKGFVLGGSLGLIPAWIGGWIIALAWPPILIVGLIWRNALGYSVVWRWAEDQFERR
jgi:hypothetical protein